MPTHNGEESAPLEETGAEVSRQRKSVDLPADDPVTTIGVSQ